MKFRLVILLLMLCVGASAQENGQDFSDFGGFGHSRPDLKLVPPVIAHAGRYLMPGPDGCILFGRDSITVVLNRRPELQPRTDIFAGYQDLLTPQLRELIADRRRGPSPDRPWVIRIFFANANPSVRIEGLGIQTSCARYLIGSDASKWTAYAPVYGGVAYRDLWLGVDLILTREDGKLICILNASGGEALSCVRMEYDGVQGLRSNDSGDLALDAAFGSLRETRPEFYQSRNGHRVALWGVFAVDGKSFSPEVRGCDKASPVEVRWTSELLSHVADPWTLGDSRRVAYDTKGAGWVGGNVPIPSEDGKDMQFDSFVARLGPTGALDWVTLIGGSGADTLDGLAFDRHGYSYIGGFTRSADLPTTGGAYRKAYNGSQDYFSAKLTPSGKLAYSSYLGMGGGALGAEPLHKPAKLLAIVVDDVKTEDDIRDLLALGIPMTFAMMPSCTPTCLDYITSHGSAAFLHAPLEALGSVNTRTKEICGGDPDERKAAILEGWLAQFPGVVGVNNHRGSMLTSDPDAMKAVLGVIRKHNLVFVDSHTSNAGIGANVARAMGVPCEQQDLFLDERTVDGVKARVAAMAELSARTGYSICICHVHQPADPPAFREMIPNLQAQGFRFVTVPDLYKAIGILK